MLTPTGAWLPHIARFAFVSRELGGDQRVLGHGHRAGPRPRACAAPPLELEAVALVSVPRGHLYGWPRTGGQGAVRDHRRHRDVGREAQIRRGFSFAGQHERLERCGIRCRRRVPARRHRGLVIAHAVIDEVVSEGGLTSAQLRIRVSSKGTDVVVIRRGIRVIDGTAGLLFEVRRDGFRMCGGRPDTYLHNVGAIVERRVRGSALAICVDPDLIRTVHAGSESQDGHCGDQAEAAGGAVLRHAVAKAHDVLPSLKRPNVAPSINSVAMK